MARRGASTQSWALAEKQARWRERNLKNASLIKEWAASAERRITHQLSGKALKQYYDGE